MMEGRHQCLEQRRLITVRDWPKYHPWPTSSAWRWYIFHAEKNGIGRCIRRVGRRVLIDEAEFFNWVDEQRGQNSSDLSR